ncbi:protein of unknown function [Chromohalobacter canadensis]|uniref:DUF4214 domain-containing protein n=1 Tax=Chromohalobacter canadensis TaxID=141389 RepID=A0A285VFD8_9GAMM|nr:DUF4214 domain-containing protein [Chromohalobacter canadensis]SOC52844.1 protein of unknown function [Chromohalobacter canadensis]
MPSALAQNDVQLMYVGFYGRPGEPSGVDYWAEEVDQNDGDLSSIAAAFGNSSEFTGRYGDLNDVDLVNNLYQQLFNRDAEPSGIEYWTGELDEGNVSLGNIVVSLINGAQGEDASSVVNKLVAANYYTRNVLDSSEAVENYSSGGTVEDVSETLANVGSDPATVDAAIDEFRGDEEGVQEGENPETAGETLEVLLSGAGASVDDLTTSLGSTVGDTVDGLVTTLTESSGVTSSLTGDEGVLSGLLDNAVVGSDENDGSNPLGDLLADESLLDSLANLDGATDVSGLLSDEGLGFVRKVGFAKVHHAATA